MSGLQIVVQWLHVLGGIFWFGSSLYAASIFAPTLMSLPPQIAGPVFAASVKRTAVVLETVGGMTILLGVIRGTLFGPVQSFSFLFGTTYGITWAVALLLGLGILGWSHFVVAPAGNQAAAMLAVGDIAGMRRGLWRILVEMVGFFGIFTCMILMRFGL